MDLWANLVLETKITSEESLVHFPIWYHRILFYPLSLLILSPNLDVDFKKQEVTSQSLTSVSAALALPLTTSQKKGHWYKVFTVEQQEDFIV